MESILSYTDSDDECDEIEIKLDQNQTFTLLTGIVRNQYQKFLKKQLEDNVRTCWRDEWMTENQKLEALVQKCAQDIEDLAIKAATLTQLYQRAMVKSIDHIRRSTKECRLLKELEQLMLNISEPKSVNCNNATKATQTKVFEETAQVLTSSRNTKTKVTQTIFDKDAKSTQTKFCKEEKATQTKLNKEEKSTQANVYVEPVQTLTLDERINLIQKQLNDNPNMGNDALMTESNKYKSNREQRKRRSDSKRNDYNRKRLSCTRSPKTKVTTIATTPVWHSPTPPPQSLPKQSHLDTSSFSKSSDTFEVQLEGDAVAEELEKLFMEQETDFEEIFGISLNNKLTDCDNKKSPMEENVNKTETNDETISKVACVSEAIPTETKVPTKIDTPNIANVQNNQIYRQPVTDLRHSSWPCESFMQKRRLSATLTRLVEEDIRWYDVLKMQFSLLFGEYGDPHDDFAPCSPSLELDEIIISSCMRRISPWVVRHLMKPLQDGLIGNRFLFKKLAKKLAYHIITENQYPNELVIKNAVENFFCLHRAVMTADDLDDIETMTIIRSE